MSNRKEGESPSRRKSKVSLAMTIIQGLGDPNPSPEWAREMARQLIFCPFNLFSIKRRRAVSFADYWISVRGIRGNPSVAKTLIFGWGNLSERSSQKSFKEPNKLKSYRKPTQVDWCKCTKANERNFVKELGKTARRKFARCLPRPLSCSIQYRIKFVV